MARRLSGLAWIALAVLAAGAHADTVTYGYDATGRLINASASGLNSAHSYQYDSAGNIVSSTASPLTALSISGFAPNRGSPGTTVKLFGSGFSTTPSANTVSFNGATATVSSATATQLVVSVPATAMTGAISVSVGSSSVTSAAPFTVVPGNGAPTISSFSPANGAAGTVVTIVGTGFAASSKVLLNGVAVRVTSASTTQLVFTVAPNIGTGPIQVVTPAGVATSSSYFTVLRSGQNASDISATGTATVNGSTIPLTLSSANQVVLAYFSGTQADLNVRVLVDTPSFNFTAQVYDPSGAPVGASFGVSPAFIDIPRLPRNGVYTVQISAGTNTGQMGVTVAKADTKTLDMTWQWTANTANGAKARKTIFRFNGTQYQNVVMTVAQSSLTNTTGDGYPRRSLYDSAGNLVWQGNTTCCSQVDVTLPQLSKTDTYSYVVDPGRWGGTEFFSSGLRVSMTPDGTPGVLALFPNGTGSITGRAMFQGTAGQSATIRVTPTSLFSVSPQNTWATLYYGTLPSSTTYLMTSNLIGPTYSIQLRNLPATATYYLEIAAGTSIAPQAVQLLSAPGTTNLTNASPYTLTIPNPNQLAKLTFTGNVGDYIGIGMPTNNLTNKRVELFDPNQSQFFAGGSPQSLWSSFSYPFGPLTVSGTYTMYVLANPTIYSSNSILSYSFDSASTVTGSETILISTPVTGTISIGGSTVPININRVGQGARFTFTANSSQAPKFYSTGVTFTGGSFCQAALGLYPPGQTVTRTYQQLLGSSNTGNPIIYPSSSGNANVINFLSLPQTGTYTIEIQTAPGCTVNLTGRLSLT